jgi:hypothetical protein
LGFTKRIGKLGNSNQQPHMPLFFLPAQKRQQPPHLLRTHTKTRGKQEDCKKREGRTRNRSTEQKRRRWKAVRKKTSGRRRKYEMGKPLDLVKHSIECPPLFTLISLLALS